MFGTMTNAAIDIAGTGFTVLDRVYPDEGAPFEALGGSCGNVLVSLAMLDHSVAPVLALGWDDVGRRLISEFHQAGANTNYIFRRSDIASPVLAQQVDTASGQHCFSFICPETDEHLPRYRAIENTEVECATEVLNACSVFYTDRLTDAIVSAMELAHQAGALIYFEPSSIDDWQLFERAVAMATILKCSAERLGSVGPHVVQNSIAIVTHGAAGLEIVHDGDRVWCDAIPAPQVRDTCGSGDMVSVGVIDWFLRQKIHAINAISVGALREGVVAGQRLAAANCAFVGARGLFSNRSVAYVRALLDDESADQFDLFD